jgi:hypothetical protein
MQIVRRSVNLHSSCANLKVCSASSRVGDSTMARAPAFSECCRSVVPGSLCSPRHRLPFNS